MRSASSWNKGLVLTAMAVACAMYPVSSADLNASGQTASPGGEFIALAQSPAVTQTVAGTVGVAAIAVAPRLTPEKLLLDALDTFRAGEVEVAMTRVQSLVAEQPNFRLAHLVHGDMLASLAGAPLSMNASSGVPRDAVAGMIAEARQRVRRAEFEPGNRIPASLLQLSERQRYGVAVDLSRSRLYLFRNEGQGLSLVGDYYVSGGKNGAGKQVMGDKKTPIGVYFITSRLPGDGLPDKYGPMAFPVDYPNDWDRRHGRTGDGIWLHGVATSTYSRPPLDSDGCVAMSNDDLSAIADLMQAGVTPVVIGNQLDWVSPDAVRERKSSLDDAIARWRTDWESGDIDKYLAHYDQTFRSRKMDKRAWSDYKRQVTANKRFIRVAVSDMSMFAYPDVNGMAVVTFKQRYESDRFASDSRKRQYWQQRDGRWRIISESAI